MYKLLCIANSIHNILRVVSVLLKLYLNTFVTPTVFLSIQKTTTI